MDTRIANFTQTLLLLGAMTALFLGVGWLVGGREGAIIALVISVVTNLVAWYSSGSMAIRASGAVPVSEAQAPRLHQVVEQLAHRANIPKPEIYLVESEVPNAFATGRSPAQGKIAVTSGIMRILDDDELGGVIAHELAHIDNYDILTSSIAAALAGAVAYLASMARYSMMYAQRSRSRGNPIGAILAIILAPIAATIIRLAITRSREIGADEEGAHLNGDPLALASALQKLEAYSLSHQPDAAMANPAISHMWIVPPELGQLKDLFRTHPSTEERVRRLQALAGEMRTMQRNPA
jgi:heat shock protein HtpX